MYVVTHGKFSQKRLLKLAPDAGEAEMERTDTSHLSPKPGRIASFHRLYRIVTDP